MILFLFFIFWGITGEETFKSSLDTEFRLTGKLLFSTFTRGYVRFNTDIPGKYGKEET